MDQDRTKRKLTAIFSADVVGYSRLMEEDEAWTIQSLEENKKLIGKLIEEYEGRVVDAPGDNILAEFNSAINAVECAIKIQQELKKINDNLIESRRMHFRIGVNLGDVVEEDGRIYGNGVNIAARLEGLAEPGGICISRTAFDQVNTKLDIGYEFLGEHNVKNITVPIRAYRLLIGAEKAGKVIGVKKASRIVSRRITMAAIVILIIIAAGLLFWNIYPNQSRKIETASIEPEQAPAVVEVKEAPKTIAVLPFDNLSSDPEQVYFVDGLTEEILNSLCQIPDLTVIAKTSSFSFKGTNITIQEIASILGVNHILEGSVRKAGNALRITAQLIKADDGSHLWSDTYDMDLGVKEIFAVQEDIANNVADKLKLTIEALKQLGGTDNMEAYELFLMAKKPVGPDDINSSLESISAAIALDPEFALAWARKAGIHQARQPFMPPDKAALERDAVIDAAQKSIELEPNLPDGYFVLGQIKSDVGDWIEAETYLRKARKRITDPSLRYRVEYDLHYFAVGNFKRAKDNLETGIRIDPIQPRFFYIMCLSIIGEMEKGEEQYKLGKASMGEEDLMSKAYITLARLGSGNLLSRDDIVYSDPICDAAREHLESPKEALAELHKLYTDDNLRYMDLGIISMWAAYFGDPEFAMDAMERILDSGFSNIWFMWFPIYKETRQLPRFKEFVKEIGLVDYWNQFGWPDICRPLDNSDFVCD